MPDSPRKPEETPKDPPRGHGGDEPREPDDAREPSSDVREPPLPGTMGTEEKFPRKGEI